MYLLKWLGCLLYFLWSPVCFFTPNPYLSCFLPIDKWLVIAFVSLGVSNMPAVSKLFMIMELVIWVNHHLGTSCSYLVVIFASHVRSLLSINLCNQPPYTFSVRPTWVSWTLQMSSWSKSVTILSICNNTCSFIWPSLVCDRTLTGSGIQLTAYTL